jgi:hypothetical protein
MVPSIVAFITSLFETRMGLAQLDIYVSTFAVNRLHPIDIFKQPDRAGSA